MSSMSQKHTVAIKWVSGVVILGSIWLLMRTVPTETLQAWLNDTLGDLGVGGPVAFALIYVVATVCLVPGSILTLAAGAIFGLWVGFATISVGSVCGAAAAFLIGRYLARAKVEAMARTNAKFSAIDDAISEGGWKIVALLRLSPAIPFNLQNYLYGLTDIRFWPYLLTSWLAMIPGTFLYVYLGHAAGLAAASERERSTGEWILLAVGLAATFAVTAYITRLAKRKLREQAAVNRHALEETAPARFQ